VGLSRDLTAVSTFDEATAVRRTGDGTYEMRPDPRFAAPPSGQGPPAVNGGLLIAAMLRAVLDGSPHPHPVATNAHFLRVPAIAPARVEVTWLKHGKTAAMARAALVQDGNPMIEAMVSTGSLPDPAADGTPAPSWTGTPPGLPPPAECTEMPPSPFGEHVDVRLDPATAGWLKRDPAGAPEMRGWFQLRDGREPDAFVLAFAVDALPPVVFELGALGWAPTVELTWHMRAVPAPGPLRLAARSRHVGGGWFDEESEVWDSAGRLVAQSRQLARVGRPAQFQVNADGSRPAPCPADRTGAPRPGRSRLG
jgi:Acyl-CoA thioesterase C-terminal domain/Acyl-CoA thioesterase N-terminal domain